MLDLDFGIPTEIVLVLGWGVIAVAVAVVAGAAFLADRHRARQIRK